MESTFEELQIGRSAQDRIDSRTDEMRGRLGTIGLNAYRTSSRLLSAPRATPAGTHPAATYQTPWLPLWPKLKAQPFHDPKDFPWTQTLKANVDVISRELEQVLQDPAPIPSAKYVDKGGDYWKAFYFFSEFKKNEANCERCPETTRLIESVPMLRTHVCFSVLEPNTEIPVHVGASNTILTFHLGLKICEQSYLNVGGEIRRYQRGEVLILDDSFVHYAKNEGPVRRYTLMFHAWHPDLSAVERVFLRSLAQFVTAE